MSHAYALKTCPVSLQHRGHSCSVSLEILLRFPTLPVSFHVHTDPPCIHSSHITENARKASKTEMPAIAQSQKSW